MVLILLVLSTIIFLSECNTVEESTAFEYLNHHDSVSYVGMATCAACHPDKHNTFIETGMGQSIGEASRPKSSAQFGKDHVVYDSFSDLYYYPLWKGNELYIREFRLKDEDTIHKLEVKIDHIVGSGQHTNSHLFELNGYLYQAPLTYYTQEGKWDLPPGFENGNNSRFTRMLNAECMSCHNSMPKMVEASSTRFAEIGHGIDCERCHGPGELHVKLRSQGKGVDVSKEIDPTIVNPAKLSEGLQIDLCQRCHLQGLNVLKEGKKFTDFKPGMKLSDIFNVYLPLFEGGVSKFDMANHADRFQHSECFIGSKEADIAFSCITCHNPHVSVKSTSKDHFNTTCLKCHSTEKYTLAQKNIDKHGGDCIACHMPQRGTEDILHVRVHDHKIGIYDGKEEEVGALTGLYAVNDNQLDAQELAKAYLEYWEKFDKNPFFLEKAREELDKGSYPKLEIKYYYLKENYSKALTYVNEVDELDYWTAYMVGYCYEKGKDMKKAVEYYRFSYRSNPDQPDVAVVLVKSLINTNDLKTAWDVCSELLDKFPLNVDVNTLYSELLAKQGDLKEAEKYAKLSLKLAPDDLDVWELMLNISYAGKDKENVKKWADKILKKYPKHPDRASIMTMLSTLYD